MSKVLGNEFLYEKSRFMAYLKDKYLEDPEFQARCRKNVLEPVNSLSIENINVTRRIRDINLLYTLKFTPTPNLKIESKVTGRALELVAESVLEWKLKSNPRLDYEFVDWKGFDYLILDKTTNDWSVGIQCKTCFVGSSFLGYNEELQRMKDFAKNFETGKKFVMFCGCVKKSDKEKIKHAFENIGWEFYYLWTDINSYGIDSSFYDFVDTIEKIAKT